MKIFQEAYAATRKTLSERLYLLLFFVFTLLFFGLLIYIPLVSISANTLAFQLRVFRPQDYFIMIFLALLVGLNSSMQIYTWRKQRQIGILAESVVGGATAGISGIFAAVIGTASCLSCLAFLLGLVGLGLGSVLFIFKYQMYFLIGAIVLVSVSFYFTVRKVNKTCNSCKKNKELYQCEECGLKYENKDWALKCQAWCNEHHSCNLEIIKRAVQENNSK